MPLRRIVIDIDIAERAPYETESHFGMLITNEDGVLNLDNLTEKRVKREFERLAQVAMDSLRT